MSSTDLIWKEMKEGNKNAFLIIYRQNYRYLFSYGFSLCIDKELTKDCIHEMFLELWDKRTAVNSEVANVRSYLFTWLRRKISRAQSLAKKEKALEGYSDTTDNYQNSYEYLLIAFQESEEKKEKLRRALDNLTKKQLEIIRLKFFENLSYEVISEKTSLTTRTVYNTIYEAISRLREFMNIFF
ncbi:MAG TPA: sigma-70 family RNA polymerase sigma factor [Hanamia sp.]|nr:sigma-70 family RNA polymerase sigma factor [Hanamia sp.]